MFHWRSEPNCTVTIAVNSDGVHATASLAARPVFGAITCNLEVQYFHGAVGSSLNLPRVQAPLLVPAHFPGPDYTI